MRKSKLLAGHWMEGYELVSVLVEKSRFLEDFGNDNVILGKMWQCTGYTAEFEVLTETYGI